MNTTRSLLDALHHPLRREVLSFLQREGRGSTSQIARWLGVPVGNLSYHVRRLEQLGLIEVVESVRRRGALMRVFRPTTAFRDAAAAHLHEELAGLASFAHSDTGPVTVVRLDERAITQLDHEMDRIRAFLRKLHGETVERLGKSLTARPTVQVGILVAIGPEGRARHSDSQKRCGHSP